MQRVTVEDVPSWAYRGLELFLLGPTVLSALFGIGIIVVGVLSLGSSSGGAAGAGAAGAAGTGASAGTTGAGFTALVGGMAVVWLLAIVLGLLSIVAVPLFLYLDASKVAEQGLEWEPSPGLYVVLGFFVSGLAVLHYLYKRHEYVVDWVGSEAWWYVAMAGAALGIVGVVGAAANPIMLGVAMLGLPLFVVGIYRDATFVRLNSEWRPNPVNHFLIGLLSAVLVVPGVLYFGYFAYKRHSHVGLV
ncbi:hypothetical protein [Halosimplex halobium]|uniref:hypothetical protein n=1 Tax=Halosimplex halobium TaxID=3396618 RepID=UPI003F55B7F2